MAKEIKFRVKLNVDGKDQLVTATTSAKELQKNLEYVRTSSDRTTRALMNIANVTSTIDNFSNIIGGLSYQMMEWQKATAQVSQMTGKTGKDLTEFRNEVQSVSDTFGEDFSDVMKAVNSLAKGFGVSVEDAMKLIRDGFVSGANANGEFIDTLAEYPRYFKEAGISAEEFVAITTNAAKQGIFSDKGVDAIKEGNLRIREMTTATASALDAIGISSEKVQEDLQNGSKNTFDIMQEVGRKLQELPASSAKVGTAIADIFGGPGEDAGLEYIKSLADIELNMDNVRASADDASKSMDSQMQTILNVKNAIMGVVDVQQILSDTQPYLTYAASIGMAATAIKGLNIQHALLATRSKVASAALLAAGVSGRNTAAVARTMTALFKTLTLQTGMTTTAMTGLKIAIRGLMVSTGVGVAIVALTTAIESLIGKSEAASNASDGLSENLSEEEQSAKDLKDTYDQTLQRTYGELVSKYTALQSAWKSLSNEHQRKQWITENQSAFENLKLSIHNVTDAENTFNGNTDTIVTAFKKRAEAAAYAAKLTKLYEQRVTLEDKKQRTSQAITQDARATGRSAQAGDVIPENYRNKRYGGVARDGQWRFSEKGAALYSGTNTSTNPQIQALDKQLKSLDSQIDATVANMTRLNTEAGHIIKSTSTPTKTGGKAGGTIKNTGTTTKADPLKGSIDWYESAISDLDQKAQATADEATATALVSEKKKLEDELKQLKIRVGIEDPDKQEVQEAAEKPLDLSTREGKRERYSQLSQQASTLQNDLDIGAVDGQSARDEIAEINEELASLGLEPLELHVDSDDAEEGINSFLGSLNNIDLSGFDSVKNAIQGITDITDPTTKGFAAAGAACSALGGAMQQLGSDSEAAKAGMVMAAIGEIVLSFAEALRSAKTWVEWLAFGISGAAMMTTLISQISGFKDGGIVGGNSKSGDKLIARVNSGEMILNTQQQQRLWNIVNGSTGYQSVAGAAAQNIGGNFSMTVSGRNLVGVLANETRISSKSGRSTNIKI